MGKPYFYCFLVYMPAMVLISLPGGWDVACCCMQTLALELFLWFGQLWYDVSWTFSVESTHSWLVFACSSLFTPPIIPESASCVHHLKDWKLVRFELVDLSILWKDYSVLNLKLLAHAGQVNYFSLFFFLGQWSMLGGHMMLNCGLVLNEWPHGIAWKSRMDGTVLGYSMDDGGCWSSKQHAKNKNLAWSESRLMT